jgi:exodeoxyribonuclease VII small subunit
MQRERPSRRGSSRSPLVNGSDQPPETIALAGLADYDKAIAEIDAIIAQLEDGQHSLDEEMRLYEHAMRLAHACDQLLQGAELRVEKLRSDLGTETPSFILEDFEIDDE